MLPSTSHREQSGRRSSWLRHVMYSRATASSRRVGAYLKPESVALISSQFPSEGNIFCQNDSEESIKIAGDWKYDRSEVSQMDQIRI